MKLLLWIGIVVTLTVSLLIGCIPGPAPAATIAQVHDWPSDASQPLRTCDALGVCCYTVYRYGSISCVATKVKVVVVYEEPKAPAELRYQCGDFDNHGELVFRDCGAPVPFQPDTPKEEFRYESQRQPTIGGEVRNPALEARLLRNYRFGDH